jgi:imidazolonepropionase-like amidohydrolase
MGSCGALALTGGCIYLSPTHDVVRDGVVVIERGKVAAVGPRGLVPVPRGSETLDCSGSTIAAGLWNSHVHFFERKWADVTSIPAHELSRQLEVMLTRYGFTSVFDVGSMWENTRQLRARIESGEVCGPRIRSTGPGLIPPGALPPAHVVAMMGVMPFPAPEIADAAKARAAVKRLIQEGVDGIKLFASSPRSETLCESTMCAAVNEAHRSSRPVFAHPESGADLTSALRAGVNVIAHTTPRTGAWDEALLSEIRRTRAALTPTLALWKFFARHDRIRAQDEVVAISAGQLRAWVDCGGAVLFGTDLGAVDPDPSDEYALMAAAGMNFRELLASLTTVPAARFGDATVLGQIAAGFEADLVVFEGDPESDVRALADVKYTIRSGKIIYRGAGPRDGASTSGWQGRK